MSHASDPVCMHLPECMLLRVYQIFIFVIVSDRLVALKRRQLRSVRKSDADGSGRKKNKEE